MSHDQRKYPILAAILFALAPACIVGLASWLAFAWWIGLAVGIGVFGLGMDVLLNGKDTKEPK